MDKIKSSATLLTFTRSIEKVHCTEPKMAIKEQRKEGKYLLFMVLKCFPAFSPKQWDGLQHPHDPIEDKKFEEGME